MRTTTNTDTIGQTRETHQFKSTHTNPACTQCRQCPSSNTIIRMSISVLRANNLKKKIDQLQTRIYTRAPPPTFHHRIMTVEQLPPPCKKCATFLYARRTYVHVGDFHVDSENGIPSSYVSALMPCAPNATTRNTCCPFHRGALLAHVPRSKKHTHMHAK